MANVADVLTLLDELDKGMDRWDLILADNHLLQPPSRRDPHVVDNAGRMLNEPLHKLVKLVPEVMDPEGFPLSMGNRSPLGRLCSPLGSFLQSVTHNQGLGAARELEEMRKWAKELRHRCGSVEGVEPPIPRDVPEVNSEVTAPEASNGFKPSQRKASKKPSREAFQASALKNYTGRTQAEVAAIMSKELGREIQQYQISRWLDQVREWHEAGNPIPTPEQLRAQVRSSRTATVDPASLEQGPRKDGRRPKRCSDD